MQTSVEFKGFEPEEGARTLIDRLAERIGQRTKHLSPTMLRVVVERTPVHERNRISITFDVPGETLAATDEAPELEPAIRADFAALERRIETYKATVRGEHWWKRLSRRKDLRELKGNALADEEEDAAAFHAAVDPHVTTLSHFVRHLVRYAESRGDLPEGELDPEDLASEVLLRAYEEWRKKRPEPPIRGWLMRLAMRELQEEIERFRGERRRIHIDTPAPQTPPSEWVTRLGEDILYFYQPDETLKLEDVLPDIRTPSAEEELERRELRQCVRDTLNELPGEQRRALILRYVMGYGEAEVSNSLGKPKTEVEQLLEEARNRLRDRLTKAGCTFDPHGAERSPATAWELTQKQLN